MTQKLQTTSESDEIHVYKTEHNQPRENEEEDETNLIQKNRPYFIPLK